MTRGTTSRDIRAAMAASVLFLAPAASAQDTERQAPPLLQGPEVQDTRAPGTDSRFSTGMERAREAERPVPLRVYERILGQLRAPEKSADAAPAKTTEAMSDASAAQPVLSADQEKSIDAILDEHRRAMRAFYREHREEFERLRRDAGQTRPADRAPADGDGPAQRPQRPVSATPPGSGTPGQDEPKPTPASAREQLLALRAKGPQESVVIERIWGVLNDAQRAHVQGQIEEYRAEMMRRREMQKLGDRTDQAPAESARPGSGVDLDRLPPRVRERLQAMSPEDRERALRRLRERREQQSPREAPTNRDKPAPSVDEIDLPNDD